MFRGGSIREIVIALIRDMSQILVARRNQDVHLGGFWEFPGGKPEKGECHMDALRRECSEELGILVDVGPLRDSYSWDYKDRQLTFYFYDVSGFEGTPQAVQSQEIRWVPIASLLSMNFPPANERIIHRLVSGLKNGQ